jgi:adenosine deaminase
MTILPRFFACLIFSYTLILTNGHSEEMRFTNMPKGELHLHLGGSFPKEYLMSIADTDQQEDLLKALDLVQNGVDYNEAFTVFRIIAKLIDTEEKLQEGVEQLCLSLQKDGVRYVEIRTGLKDLGKGHEAYLNAVLRGMSAHASERFEPKLVLSLQRNSSPTMADITIALAKKYQAQGVVGIDISGDSTMGKIEQIMPQLLSAKDAGLPFLLHLGEHPKETDQLYLLKMLEPKRVGHAVHLTNGARDWILHHQIPIEICLSSSVLVRMISQFDQHPGIEFFKKGHPIVFCTDDPLLFSTTLSKELQLAHQFCGLSEEEIEQVVRNSFQHAL